MPTASEQRTKPTREQALAIAASRKAARRARTSRIRRTIAVIGAVAFLGPFGVIYTQLASGHDPALGTTTQTVASTPSAPAATTATTATQSTQTTQTTQTTAAAPAAVTTQQS
ncbi:MAG: hypothetical protein QOH13_2075 [Thermoleophilaceae bacterium]|nr:hypothetical protein [Thermoleophilaceae bacterium]